MIKWGLWSEQQKAWMLDANGKLAYYPSEELAKAHRRSLGKNSLWRVMGIDTNGLPIRKGFEFSMN